MMMVSMCSSSIGTELEKITPAWNRDLRLDGKSNGTNSEIRRKYYSPQNIVHAIREEYC